MLLVGPSARARDSQTTSRATQYLFFLLALLVTPIVQAQEEPSLDPAMPSSAEIREITPKAEFIFIGTIQLKNSSTLTLLAGNVEDLAVVQVDEILQAPAIFQRLQQVQITVKMKHLADAKIGEQRVFFANGWLFGESLAVVEVSSYRLEEREAAITKLRSQVEEVVQDTKEKALSKRLARASVVVYGRVTAVAEDPNVKPMLTEHDPDWWTATVAVETVLKGNVPDTTLTFSFAHSTDVMWANAPKPEEGELGIWILHDQFPEGLEAPNSAPLESEDFRPPDDLQVVQRLVQTVLR